MTEPLETGHRRRVYPLDAHELTEEQIAVAFAMTSRRPEPFDEIAQQVSQEKAADFHERWVVGYGHASVAEHAVLHLAVEDISRLACDTLEDNRLASYTEKSSRYQLFPSDYFFLPSELSNEPKLVQAFGDACRELFQVYHRLVEGCVDYLRGVYPQRERERDAAYNLRLQRDATDSCRAVLPAATLTNVGVTANARVLEHAISKLMSSELGEERDLGGDLREQGQKIAPTLIKYAEPNTYMGEMPDVQRLLAGRFAGEPTSGEGRGVGRGAGMPQPVRLLACTDQAEEKLAAALLYRQSSLSYDEIWRRVLDMSAEDRQQVIQKCVAGMGSHDAPVREFELVDYTFEYMMDYGAYREFKRHRMQSYIPQSLTTANGYGIPVLMVQAGLKGQFVGAIEQAEDAYSKVYEFSPVVAQYLVTHAHYRRVLSKLNLKECYHLFKLRTSELAHFAIREPMVAAMKLAVEAHPGLFQGLQLRD